MWVLSAVKYHPVRNGKPYVTNGVNSEFCERFVDVPAFEPSVKEAFEMNRELPASATPVKSPREEPYLV